ncbi:uncharacterized protein LOC140703824 [Pogona vitticeps]
MAPLASSPASRPVLLAHPPRSAGPGFASPPPASRPPDWWGGRPREQRSGGGGSSRKGGGGVGGSTRSEHLAGGRRAELTTAQPARSDRGALGNTSAAAPGFPLQREGAWDEQGASASCPPGRERAWQPRLAGARDRRQTPQPGARRGPKQKRRRAEGNVAEASRTKEALSPQRESLAAPIETRQKGLSGTDRRWGTEGRNTERPLSLPMPQNASGGFPRRGRRELNDPLGVCKITLREPKASADPGVKSLRKGSSLLTNQFCACKFHPPQPRRRVRLHFIKKKLRFSREAPGGSTFSLCFSRWLATAPKRPSLNRIERTSLCIAAGSTHPSHSPPTHTRNCPRHYTWKPLMLALGFGGVLFSVKLGSEKA